MTRRDRTLLGGGAALALVVGAGGYWFGTQADGGTTEGAPASASQDAAADGREVLYWYDPMVPGQRFDKPGKSPFMDMQLMPKYADEGGGATGGVRVSSEMQQSLGIRIGRAEMADFAPELRAVGRVEIDERRIVDVQTLTPGYVERLTVRAVGEPVRRGQTLATVYSPDLYAAQKEFAALRGMSSAVAPASLRNAASERLKLLGLSAGAIRSLGRGGSPQRTFAVAATSSGVVTAIGARPGARVGPGESIVTLADLSQVLVVAEVPEASLGQIKVGLPVSIRFPAYPELTRDGSIDYIFPSLDPQSRAARVRVTLANPAGRLKEGMLANLTIGGTGGMTLTVPSEAVIRTGKRDIVIVSTDGGFRPAEVEIGREAGGRTQILSGLSAGEQVVVSGQFLIDSEAQLSGLLARLGRSAPPAGGASSPTADALQTTGVIKAIDANTRRLTIAHGPVPAMKWPAMTMGFAAPPGVSLDGLNAGDRIRFSFGREASGGIYPLTAIAARPKR